MPRRLSESTQNLYSDLVQLVAANPYANLSGGAFVSKVVKGSRYWYYQLRTARGQIQRYLGRESEMLLEQIADAKAAIAGLQPILDERRRLVAMLTAGGAAPVKGRIGKILQGMADAGVFVSGGVLVGHLAFAAYGNMLGVRLDEDLCHTADAGSSGDREIEVGVGRESHDDRDGVEPATNSAVHPGLLSVPLKMLTPDGFPVDFVTSRHDPSDSAPVEIKRLGVKAHPVEFLDYLVADAQLAVILHGSGIPVKVPNPAHYALHKLAMSTRRRIGNQARIRMDRVHAEALIAVLAEDNPDALLHAVKAVGCRNDNLVAKIIAGAEALPVGIGTMVVSALR